MKRIISAIILIPLALGAIFYTNQSLFALLLGLLSFGLFTEFEKNFLKIRKTFSFPALYVFLIAPCYLFFHFKGLLFLFILIFILISFEVLFFEKDLDKSLPLVSQMIFAVLYTGLLPLSIMLVRDSGRGEFLLLFAFVIVWSNDIFAYFFGRALGKNKLWQRVSPGKTIEGAFFGVLFAFILGYGYIYAFDLNFSNTNFIILVLLMSVFSICGDLFESMLKRSVSIKDSGTIIPGHGGLLDRLDSILFAIQPLAFYIYFF